MHRGLHGTAYTVFEGSTPEPIDVEILGVLRDAIGPGKDMILARLTGAKAEYDGVVAGMSGSPVYVNGKLLGAIGYRIGQFTRQPIAGITPIQQMLDVFPVTKRIDRLYNAENRDSANTLSDPPITPEISTTSLEGMSGSSVMSDLTSTREAPTIVQPIATPLVFDGFSVSTIERFRQRFGALGMIPVAGLGGATPNAPDKAPVVPGSAISAVIVSGDFNLAATCTVTYVDPKHLLACGHPITRYGNVSLPMDKAVVVATVASQLSPMKIINTTANVGSFTEDRDSGILGVFGKKAQMIPVTLTIRGESRTHIYHFAIAEHPRLTSSALIASIYQAMQDTNSYNDPSTYKVTGSIRIAGYPDVRIDEMVAPTNKLPSSLTAAVSIAQRFNSIFSNTQVLPDIQSVSLDLDASPGRHSATLAEAYALTPTVRAGELFTIEATLHPYRKPQRPVRIPVRLPETLKPGPVRLLVSDGTTLDHTLHLIQNPAAPTPGLAETITRLNQLHPTDRLYVTLLVPVPQASLRGHDLPAIPLTVANVLQPENSSGKFSIDGETALPLANRQINMELSGSRVIMVNVRP